jgi:hypothetical protein
LLTFLFFFSQLRYSRTSKIKDLKFAVATKFGLDVVSVKLLIKGSSAHADSTRLCDITGLSSPVTVTVLSGALTTVSVSDIDKKKYDEATQAIQESLNEAITNRGATLSSSSIAQLVVDRPTIFENDGRANIELNGRVNRPLGHVELQLPLFSGAMLPIGNPPSDFSNQVVLPNNLLQQFTQEEVPFPIVLEASRLDVNGEMRVTHVIPGEYHARIDGAYAPYQILQDLGAFDQPLHSSSSPNSMDVDNPAATSSSSLPASTPFTMTGEGVLVSFKTTQLPLGTTATLQPLEFDWLTAIPEDQQKAVLENQLRRYLCLSLHDTIRIKHLNRTFRFKVVSLEPAPAVSLASTDLAVEILLPMDAPQHANLTQPLGINTRKADSDSPTDTSLVVNLKKGESSYFELEFNNPNLAILFEVQSLEGFVPAIYVCTRRPYPTPSDHIWSSENFSELSERQVKKLQQTGRRRVLLSQDDPKFTTGRFFVGVHASLADASCTFRAIIGLKSELAKGFSSGPTSGSLLSSSGAEPPANSSQCAHCSRWIPTATITLHQLQCSRLNWVCPTCQFVCPVSEKDKHTSIAHAIVKCECGFESEGDLVALHREFECHLRPFSCPYCNLSMPYGNRASHIRDCGSRTTKCSTCNVWVKNSDMAAHQMDIHHSEQPPS